MKIRERYNAVLSTLEAKMGKVGSELNFGSPFQLLVAVMLSAQCTDKRVNAVTPALFRKYPDAASLAKAGFEDVYELVKSVSYPNSKSRHIIAMAAMLVSDFNSEVPSDPDELVKLPGVGRKTANVVAAIIYGKPVIAVDTHVFRVSRRIGLSRGTTVEAVCRDLTGHIPAEKRADAHHWLLLHGRYICTARNPKCAECPITDFCASYNQASENQ
ncbi:MAG: endonuclease III [Rikenellaceae bacterium]|nr:endonuclease III [Rikenellaceae bacterium]